MRRTSMHFRRSLFVLGCIPAFIAAYLFTAALSFAAQPYTGRYALILSDPPVAQRLSSAGGQAGGGMSYRQRIQAAQVTLRRELENRKYRVTGSVQVLLNAVFVQASRDQVAELRSLPGVKAVVPVRRLHLRLDRAVQLQNIPAAWSALGGTSNAGAGIKIGILDTGIDQTHPAFQDPSLQIPGGFPKCQGQDCSFTTNKVIVARSYVPLLAAGSQPNPAADSRPDDVSPRDHVGHGTALAMITAGVTNSGPADTITGIAPKAWLGSYKIFGSPGVNDFTGGDVIIQALEDALNDGMDVAVLSLGGPALTGPLDQGQACGVPASTPCDPEAAAVENAVRAGMAVVVAAGNSGDSGSPSPTLNTIESPATAPSAIAAGATTNSHVFTSTLRISGSGVPSNLQAVPAIFGDGPLPPQPVSAPVRDVSTLDGTGNACDALPPSSLNGAFALIMRSPGVCGFATKITNVQNAGATGAIIIQISGSDTIFAPGGLTSTEIPAVMIGNADGSALKSYLAVNPNLQATLDPTLAPMDTSVFNTVAGFSSRGPSITYLLKPEVMGVGTDVYMATQNYDPNGEMYDPSRYTVASGTSFSAPMVAGVIALAKQKNPGLTSVQLKSAVVNTATQDVTDNGAPAGALAGGNGKVSGGDAVQAAITVDPATLSLGAIGQSSDLPASQKFTVHYAGTGAAGVTLKLTPDRAVQNAPLLDRTTLSLTPGQDQQVTLTLSGTKPPAGVYTGSIAITGAAAPVRVPYLYVVGDGMPANAVPLLGTDFDGTVGQLIPDGAIAFKITDQYGVAVPGVPVTFSALGGATAMNADQQTDQYGIAAAEAVLGPNPGSTQGFVARGGGFRISFTGIARTPPAFPPNGVVNAASYRIGPGIAPGSYIAIFGTDLTDASMNTPTASAPVSLNNASVSFDVPSANLSLPGRLLYVSPNQVNVQVPWELRGQTSVQMKVTMSFTPGQVVTVPVSDYSPAIYTTADGLAASLDDQYAPITQQNPARRGRIIQIYMNGLGPVDNQPGDGEVAQSSVLSHTTTTPTVTIGGRPVTAQFSGLAPGFPGLNQVNVVVPADAPAGLAPVVVTIGNVSSPAVNLPVDVAQ